MDEDDIRFNLLNLIDERFVNTKELGEGDRYMALVGDPMDGNTIFIIIAPWWDIASVSVLVERERRRNDEHIVPQLLMILRQHILLIGVIVNIETT